MDAGVGVKRWKTVDRKGLSYECLTGDLVLEGGKPVEILVKQKTKRREIPKLEPNENCYYGLRSSQRS